MGRVLPPIAASHVHPRPIGKASGDPIGLVAVIKQAVPTEREVDPGTMVLGMLLATRSGRSPRYRWEEFWTHQDTARRLGQTGAPEVWHDDPVGGVLERLYDVGTRQIFPACAVRAEPGYGVDKGSVPCDTPSRRVSGASLPPEGPPDQQEEAVPCPIPPGESPAKRPARKPCVVSTRCVERAVPLWGNPEDGKAADHPGRLHGGRPSVSPRVLLALELLKHELGASDEDICQHMRTDVAVMYACGLRAVQADRSQAHFVLPETLAQFRQRIDGELMDELLAIQAAAAMQEGLVSPAHLLVDTFPSEQGSQRVTDATTLYKAQKNSWASSRRSRTTARRRPRP